jgi:hypothetical protein
VVDVYSIDASVRRAHMSACFFFSCNYCVWGAADRIAYVSHRSLNVFVVGGVRDAIRSI